jgi:hypothetical protein
VTEAYVELYCKGTVSPEDLRRSVERALERIRDKPNVDHTRSVIVLSRLIERPRT